MQQLVWDMDTVSWSGIYLIRQQRTVTQTWNLMQVSKQPVAVEAYVCTG